jgi:hypothetical protein
MEVTKCECDLGSEELGLFFLEALDLNKMAEEFSSLNKVHEEIDTDIVLEDIFHVNKEGVVNRVQNIFF